MSTENREVRWVPVRELGEVRMGKQLSPASREAPRQFPYLRVANVRDGRIDFDDVKTMGFSAAEREVYGLRPGDVLLNEGQEDLRMVGRSALYTGPADEFCFQNTLIRFRSGPEVVPEYAQAVFSHWRMRGVFANVAEKTSISHLGSERFASLRFPLLPLPDQHRIVELIETFRGQEESIAKQIEKLNHVRNGLLLDFMAPVGAETLPPGWVRTKLKDLVPKVHYGVSFSLERDTRGIPVLRMNNVQGGSLDLSDLRYSPAEVPKKYELRYGDVLFNRTNSLEHVGKSSVWRDELPRASFASYLVRINPDAQRLMPEYLVEWLMHPRIRQRVRSISTAAVQQVNVNPSRLCDLDIDMPTDLGRQHRISEALNSFDRKIKDEELGLRKMRTLRVGILGGVIRSSREAFALDSCDE